MKNSSWRALGKRVPVSTPMSVQTMLAAAGRSLLVLCSYYLAARLGLLIPYLGTQVSLIWLPTGIAVAAMWRWGVAIVPAVYVAAVSANLSIGSPLWIAAGIGMGNAAGPWLSAHALKVFQFDKRLLRRQDMAAFLIAVVLGMLVTSTNGTSWLLLGGLLDQELVGRAWLSWFVGDAVGALLGGVPLIVVSRGALALSFGGRRGRVNSLLQLVLLGCGLSVFSAWVSPDSALLFPLLALPFFVVALLALRGGVLPSSTAVLLLAVAAAYGTARGLGPFARPDSQSGILALWSYITAQACTSLLICGLATELQSSRWQFSALMNHAQDGILVIGWDNALALVNPAASRMLGLQGESFIGHSVASIPHGNGPVLAALLQEKSARAGHELLLESADGSQLQIECELARYLDASGYWQTHLILRDVTQRERAKAQLADSQARLKAITDNLPALIAYVDPDQIYRFANARFRTVMGTEPERLLGQTMAQFLGAEAHAALQPHIEAALRGERQKFERTGWRDNAANHYLVEYLPDVKESGKVAGFFIMVLDITERRRAELALARSEMRIRTITDSLPAHISHIDRDLRCTFANAKVGEWFGCDAASLIGRTVREISGEEAFVVLEPKMRRALAGESISYESFNAARGRPEYFEANYVPEIDASGQVLGFYALTFEVTRRKQAENQLRESLQLLDLSGTIAGVGGWELVLGSGELRWTRQTRAIHEVSDDFTPRLDTALDFYAAESREAIEQAMRRASEEGTPWDLVLRLVTAKGRSVWVRNSGEVETSQGQAIRLFGVFQDVSERVSSERRLREQAELLQITLTSIGDGVITTDEQGRVRWMNPVAERMSGWRAAQARGQRLPEVFRIIDADTRALAPDPVAACLQVGETSGQMRRTVLLSREGAEQAIEESASPIRDAEGQLLGAVLVFRDVSEQRRTSDQLAHRATHDDLTGLANRAGFESRLSRLMGQLREHEGSHSVLMFIDLDHFKAVNDACGHAQGDRLLRQVSALMSQSVRARDTLARLGGDEFGVILEHCSVEQAQRVAQSICDQMVEFRFVHEDRQFRIGASIGLVPVDGRWENQAALLRAADQACYVAKEAGRNRVHICVDAGPDPRAREGEVQWQRRLEDALAQDRFLLFGQRILTLHARADEGQHLEVLLRLQETPDGPLIGPAAFIPLAERFGLASRLDRWVLRRVLEGLAGNGMPSIGCISVNLSAPSIAEPVFLADLLRMMDEFKGVDARRLCLELPEIAVVSNLPAATALIETLRARGVRIALDDFGASVSSLAYLKNLGVDWLKIDAQFVRHLPHAALDRATVRCIQEVAGVIGAKTIGKCVESEAVARVLQELAVDSLQGYWRHRPELLADLA